MAGLFLLLALLLLLMASWWLTRPLPALLAVVLGALVLLAGYGGWLLLRGSARTVINQAQALKNAGDFQHARAVVAELAWRRDSAPEQARASRLSWQIGQAERVATNWTGCCLKLSLNDWPGAAAQLADLLTVAQDEKALGWRNGPAMRDKAWRIKEWLDACADAGRPEHLGPAELPMVAGRLATAIQAMSATRQWPALLAVARQRWQVVTNWQDLAAQPARALGAWAATHSLTDPNPVVARLEQAAHQAPANLRAPADRVAAELKLLAHSYDQLMAARQAAQTLDLARAAALDPALPAADRCQFNDDLRQFRAQLEAAWASFHTELAGLTQLAPVCSARLVSIEPAGTNCLAWCSGPLLDQVLQGNTLAGPSLRRERTTPQGEYDRALGVEYFYAAVRALGGPQLVPAASPNFETALASARQTVAAARAFAGLFPTGREPAYCQSGTLHAWFATAQDVLAARGAVVAHLHQWASQTQGRAAVIAEGIALLLTTARHPPRPPPWPPG